MKILQGGIVLVPYPFGDQSGQKVRPAVVISNTKVNGTKDIILAQITSNIRNDDFSFILDDKMLTYSLNGYSEVRCNKIFTAEKQLIIKKISSIKQPTLSKVTSQIIALISVIANN